MAFGGSRYIDYSYITIYPYTLPYIYIYPYSSKHLLRLYLDLFFGVCLPLLRGYLERYIVYIYIYMYRYRYYSISQYIHEHYHIYTLIIAYIYMTYIMIFRYSPYNPLLSAIPGLSFFRSWKDWVVGSSPGAPGGLRCNGSGRLRLGDVARLGGGQRFFRAGNGEDVRWRCFKKENTMGKYAAFYERCPVRGGFTINK